MKIKLELTQDEIKKLGFAYAMRSKWKVEELLEFIACDLPEFKELLNEIQKKN